MSMAPFENRARLAIAVVGLGKLGLACARTVLAAEDLSLAGIVRRQASVAMPLPSELREMKVVTEATELGQLDAALVCVPTNEVLPVVRRLLEHRIAIVECATLHGEAFAGHRREIDRLAFRHRSRAIVGAGWDPGAVSLLRAFFALLAPHGHTKAKFSPGMRVHHTLAARNVRGVRDALCVDVHSSEGGGQRYVYVEMEPGTRLEEAAAVIRADPLFAGQEIIVLPIEDASVLEEQGHGVILERYGTSGTVAHQRFLLEARLDAIAVSAEVMVAAARAVRSCPHGAHSLFDVPLGSLAGTRPTSGVGDWA
jgi:diaminopimelate dehydrogenase